MAASLLRMDQDLSWKAAQSANVRRNAGGGLYAENSTVTIKGSTISGCSAYAGGGLCAENFSTIEISGGTISGCTTSEAGMGGGLYAYKSTITISRGTIENNKATYGSGVGAERLND